MGHADGLGALGLARVDGDDAAPDGLGHVGAGVDGNDQDGSRPDAVEAHGVVGKIGQAIKDEYRLQHHGGAPEYLDIDTNQNPDQLQNEPLQGGIAFGIGNGVENAADKPNDTANGRGYQSQDQGILYAVQVH